MAWNTPTRRGTSQTPRGFPLQKRSVTMAELAEDAGHMGYTSTYYPGSPAWEAEMALRKKRHEDVPLQMRMHL